MAFESLLSAVAAALNTTTEAAGALLSLIVVIVLIVSFFLLSQDAMSLPIGFGAGIIFGAILDWIAWWAVIFAALVLAIALVGPLAKE